jgi:hypothetical protein
VALKKANAKHLNGFFLENAIAHKSLTKGTAISPAAIEWHLKHGAELRPLLVPRRIQTPWPSSGRSKYAASKNLHGGWRLSEQPPQWLSRGSP